MFFRPFCQKRCLRQLLTLSIVKVLAESVSRRKVPWILFLWYTTRIVSLDIIVNAGWCYLSIIVF
jgi:hypothetical protein